MRGAAVLGAAAVLSKLIGTMQKIPLQNMAGDRVFGIYNAVYPLYILILFLATAGFPLVVSKFVSEQVAIGRHGEARRVLRVASGILAVSGVLFFVLLYLGADAIAAMMGARQTSLAIRSVSFALLLVPAMSALRGYYQGYQNMIPTAVSQVVEQSFRVATMFILLLLFLRWGYGPEWIAAGATFGSVTGALAGLSVMLYYWQKDGKSTGSKPSEVPEPSLSNPETNWRLARRLLAYAIPICLGSVALPVLTLVDSFTIPRLLTQHGLSEADALYQFGLYNHGLPLVQLVAMIASSMTAALVPAIAEAHRKGNAEGMRNVAVLSLRITWLLGLASSVGMAVLAEPMNLMFYKSAEGSWAMAVLAFTALFSTLNIVASSVLQGLGAVTAPALYLLAAAAAKIAANAALVPRWGIDGAAAAAVAAYALAGGLALAHALRAAGIRPAPGRAIIKPMLCIGLMILGLLAVAHGLPALLGALGWRPTPRVAAVAVSLAGVAVGVLVYALALLRTGVIAPAELERVPKLGTKALVLLRKLRLIR